MTPLGIILQRSDVEQQKTLEASSATVGRTRLTCRETARQRIKKSVTPDFISCLEDGKRFKSLKRHIGVHYGLTPDEFRAKWGLAYDYPMAAPAAWQVYCALCLLACAAIAQRKANAAASHAVRDGPWRKARHPQLGWLSLAFRRGCLSTLPAADGLTYHLQQRLWSIDVGNRRA